MTSAKGGFVGLMGAVGAVALAGCSVSTTPNSITFKTQPETTASSELKSTTQDWAGGDIEIRNDGVNPLTGQGGVVIQVNPTATRISAQALFAARADEEKKAEAEQSIADAQATFTLEESGGKTTIRCGHGNAHGTSSQASSGCKQLLVTIPPGSADHPHNLTIGSGIGGVEMAGAVTAKGLTVLGNGVGDLAVSVNPVQGASIQVLGQDKIDVYVPSTFASDAVHLKVAGDAKDLDGNARIITTDFPGLADGQPFGTAGTGAAEFKVETQGELGPDTITIHKQ